MDSKKYEKALPFIWNHIISLTIFIFIFLFVLWTRFEFISLNIFFLIASIYYVRIIIKLLYIIHDVKNNNITAEYMYISFIKENKFDFLVSKKYLSIQCHKVKNNKYTNEIVYLKATKGIDLKEKSYAKISYYKNSNLIKSINL